MARYANIIVDISLEKLDKTFQYTVPEELQGKLAEGMRVFVPFGKGNRQVKGYVLELTDHAEFDVQRMKAVSAPVEGEVAIESRLIALAAWIRKQYGGTMNQALKTVLPVKAKQRQRMERTVSLACGRDSAKKLKEECDQKHRTARSRLLGALLEHGELDYRLVTEKLNITAVVIRALADQHIIAVTEKTRYRNPLDAWLPVKEGIPPAGGGAAGVDPGQVDLHTPQPGAAGPPVQGADHWGKAHALNEWQMQAADAIWREGQMRSPSPCLLYGVTGSGKTEVYMELIARTLREGRQAIVLIPEIALTFQTVMRFYHRFGRQVSILNSRMSAGERYDQYLRAQKSEISVIIGPRSALFTPFPRLGIIIMDEEHEGSYKSETTPKYHAREVAAKRAQMEHALFVLGSATPSLESFYRTKTGEYRLFTMPQRVSKKKLPQVRVVDLRQELKAGNRSFFSTALQEQLEAVLKRGEQAMLFLNRRGVAGFISCRSCGHVIKCPHCDVSLSQHGKRRLVCHYCGYETGLPSVCPKCGSKYISGFRAGTEKVEQAIKEMYPAARVLRMDADTTKKKGGYEQLLSIFANRGADILIGTQMIVKGHDFPEVTLVGILAADMSLYVSDYRAAERTFQLLTQAAGRAGRGEKEGTVIIQTYQPGHYSIEAAKNQDYGQFYRQEMMFRKIAKYPPVSNLLQIFLASAMEEALQKAADRMKERIMELAADTGLQVIGPADAAVSKINDVYRKVIYLKHEKYAALVAVKDKLEFYTKNSTDFRQVVVQYDFNPMNPL